MMPKVFLALTGFLLFCTNLTSGIPARLMRTFDVSETQICFVYGGDIWTVDKTGGCAVQLTHSPGEESWPKFSPDGKTIAYTASYNGNPDIYTIAVEGGNPVRLSYASFTDRLIDWHPDGSQIIFSSARESGPRSVNQFYLVPVEGGLPQKLKIPYGELASFSADGSQLAYITKITENYPFKRYRGGLSSDILIYDFKTDRVRRITESHAIDGKPAWVGGQIYFLSDRAENMRLNIWVYDVDSAKMSQLTFIDEFDVDYMSAGPKDLVYSAGGTLYLMDLETRKSRKVDVEVVSDLSGEQPKLLDVSKQISNVALSPQSKRVAVEARGEIFSVPVKEGVSTNLTRSSGAFDQLPAWSPDGKYLAWWSDRSGEYQIILKETGADKAVRQLTNRSKGYGYTLYWSPDSRSIAFIDESNNVQYIKVDTAETVTIGNTRWNTGHDERYEYIISWSPDSRYLAYTERLENAHDAVFVFDTVNRKATQASSGFYQDFAPVFSRCGAYLFFLTNRSMSSIYSDMDDGTWIYANASQIACLPLTLDVPSPLLPRNDTVGIRPDSGVGASKKPSEDKTQEKAAVRVKIDFHDMESRLVLLPPKAGNYGRLFPFQGKLAYVRAPLSGSRERSLSLNYYDFEERNEEQIIEGINGASLSADGETLLVQSGSRFAVVKPMPGQKIKETIPMNRLTMTRVPREEWQQIFTDGWRRYRDFFYDPAMQGVDWEEMRARYGALIPYVRTRWDLTKICSDMAAELSAGHTYTFGGDMERVEPIETGFLGIDWKLDEGRYRVARIIRPAAWETALRSPLDRTGIDIKAGDIVHSVNGIPLLPDKEPYAAFEGLAGAVVSLKISSPHKPELTRDIVVTCLSSAEERELRNLEWIESNRRRVEEISGGKLGYIYMSNTSGKGQSELVRMFYGQLDKEGFIIDERFNGGGQLADRFLELLRRPVVYNLHWRNGKDHTQPVKANNGPMGMLINGWAGSGGDGLPWAFQELKAGPIVGERTLGILVGPATGHSLIDGGGITVPDARLYDNDGHWFWEGEGVKPDIEVWDDPNQLIQGHDPQLEKVVAEVMSLLKTQPKRNTPAPAPEDRTAAGLNRKKK